MTTSPTPVPSASSYRQRRQEGQIWRAPSGEPVRVRTLDLSDHVILNQFPDYLRQMIYKQIAGSAKLRIVGENSDQELDEEDSSPFDGLSPEEVLQREYELGIVLCKVSWIAPRWSTR
jgi:hypothetical protein